MKIIDTHAHLDHLKDLPGALQRAEDNGVEAIVAVSEDISSSQRNLEISRQYAVPRIYVSMGMHPSETDLEALEGCKALIDAHQKDICAIGEVGLDFWYKDIRKNPEKKEQQKTAFRFFLNIAGDLDLPVIIHSRGAWSESLELTQAAGISRAVFHWYSGPEEVLQEILASGYYISATPSLLYSAEARKAVAQAPLEKILIETDTPVYYRNRQTGEGFQAEPKDVVRTWELLCSIKNTEGDETLRQLNQNAKHFFNF